MKLITKITLTGLLLTFGVLEISGCGGIKVAKNNSFLVADDGTTPAARVYFIRPRLLKPKGYADKEISVSLDGQKFLEIEAGSYTLLYLKPGQVRIATHSMTAFTNRVKPINVSRYRDYVFKANLTYFVYLKQLNEEFRGIFYDPYPATLTEVRNLLDPLTAFGEAQRYPIESVTRDQLADVDDEASKLPPAFPEDLYPQEKYLLHPSPFKR